MALKESRKIANPEDNASGLRSSKEVVAPTTLAGQHRLLPAEVVGAQAIMGPDGVFNGADDVSVLTFSRGIDTTKTYHNKMLRLEL
jgi:hypothetical protein